MSGARKEETMSSTYDELMERINKVRERNRKEYKALVKLTGRTIREVEADLTAPDSDMEDEDDTC